MHANIKWLKLMRRALILACVLSLLLASPALGQNWADNSDKAPDAPVVQPDDTPDASLKASAAEVMKRRPFFNIVRNRRLGLTAWGIGREVVAIHKAGELDGLSQEELAIGVAVRLAEKHPEAWVTCNAQWETENPVATRADGDSFLDRVIAFILRWLPLILLFI